MMNNTLGYLDWISRAFKAREFRILLVGSSWAGKSTLLHQWKAAKFMDLYPAIQSSFEVETFEYPRKCSWTVFNVTLGTDIVMPLLRHYFHNTQAVLYVHNCEPRLDGTDENVYHLHLWVRLMLEKGCRFLYIVPNKQDMLPPAKARDLADELRNIYEKELAEYQGQVSWRILGHKISAKTGEGVREILDKVYTELSSEIGVSLWTHPQSAQPKTRTSEPEIRTSKPKIRTSTVSNPSLVLPIKGGGSVHPPDARTFWALFSNGNIPVWDHHMNLKAAYLLVLEYLQQGKSTSAMADAFLACLRKFRAVQPEKLQDAEHRTMTIFWLLQLQIAIRDYKNDKELLRHPCWHEFHNVLSYRESLKDPRMWRSYYTEYHLFGSRQAWDEWVPPDRQPFPMLLPLPGQPPCLPLMSDADRLLQFAFVVEKYRHMSASGDDDLVTQALPLLESTIIRLRARNLALSPYSKTQACFWIHIVRACLRSLKHSDSSQGISPPLLSVTDFQRAFSIQPASWMQHYSGALWESMTARVEFVPPEKKPLPDVINVSFYDARQEVLENKLHHENAEQDRVSMVDALLAVLCEPGTVVNKVPPCCSGTLDCDEHTIGRTSGT
ncbi:hypothetical protein BJX61DRAFT_501286 [Aspergillus egyptiacus]|nr:hypothetical protein BJX61DRAFT_501286 [Aspergillus egyptiacus]